MDGEQAPLVEEPRGYGIRDAEERDLPAIVRLYQAIENTTWEYTEEPHTLRERRAWLAECRRAGWPVVVADECGEVVGVATFGEFRDAVRWPGYRFTVEHTIHVDRAHHRSGIGRALMDELLGRARASGLRVMVAAVDSTNTGSLVFHERLGFVETARMPGVGDKWGRRLDLVLLQRDTDSSVP